MHRAGPGQVGLKDRLLTFLSDYIASGNLVEASGYKFTEKDTKPGKMKVKKTSKGSTKKKADGTLIFDEKASLA